MVLKGFRGMETESSSEVLYFGTRPAAFLPRKTLKKEYKLWARPLQICCMQSKLLAVEVRSNKNMKDSKSNVTALEQFSNDCSRAAFK